MSLAGTEHVAPRTGQGCLGALSPSSADRPQLPTGPEPRSSDVRAPSKHVPSISSPSADPPSTGFRSHTPTDKGGSIPTSNALSSSLKSRLSNSAPISPLSSSNPASVISSKPYAASHDHAPASSTSSSAALSAATSSLLMLSSASGSTTSHPDSSEEDAHIKAEDGDVTRPTDRHSSREPSPADHDPSANHVQDGSLDQGEPGVRLQNRHRHEHDVAHDRQQEHSHQQSDRDTAMTDVSMGAVSKSTTDPPTAIGKKRLASPHLATTSRREPSMASGSSMTPSPRLPPQNSHNPAGSSSPRPRKNSVSSTKKEHKVGVTATSCANCGTTTTPLWRRASNGQTICNACGLYFKARNLTRPPWLKRNMGPKKGETASEEVDELQERNGPSGSGPGAEGQSASATDKAADSEDKNNDSECAGSCPGDGNCNGAGGAESCAGCPSFNQHQANRQHLVCANCRTTTTPLWRRDSGGNTICNACGLYFKLHNVHRPVTMKRAVIKRRKRVNLLASSPPPEPQPGAQPSSQQQQDEQKSQQKEQQQQQARMQMQSKFKSQQSKQATDKSAQPTASDLEPSDNDAQGEKQTRAPIKRRKVQGANGTRVPAIEDFILPKRSANGQTEWLPRESGAPEPRRSVSPIENIGNGGHVDCGRERKDYEQHRYGSYASQDQGSPYSQRPSRTYDHHGPPCDRPSQEPPLEQTQKSHRYHHPEHDQYPSHQAMSMSRYTHLPPPPPRGEPKTSAQPSQTAHHAHQHPHAHQQHPSHHHQHSQHHSQEHHPHGITMQGYQGSQSHRAMDVDDNMHPSQYSSSSGWNQRLPGYATVSSSAFSTRLSSTGVVRSSGPDSSSPPLYPRQSPSSPVQTYSHYRSPGPQGPDYHRGESPSPYGSGSSQASTNGSTYHHSFSSILNPIHSGHGDSSDRGAGRKDGPTHLPPISLPSSHHSTSHQQPLPRASEILHPQQSQQEAGSHHSHHHGYSAHQRRPTPPLPMNGSSAAAPSTLASAPPPPAATNGAVGAGLRTTEVLQQTREDLQREVSHLSMLLGRAAAVLNGLDQALVPTANGAPTSVAESHHGALSALSSDVKTSSALASLMALSASGERGSGNSADGPAYPNGSSSSRHEDVHMHSQAYPPPRRD